MSEEIEAIFNSIRSINNNSNKSQWIVEAIIPSPDLTESIYSTLGCFDDYKSANSYCIELTEKVPYNFISFRVKKLGIFMNFINKDKITHLTTDLELNKTIIKQKEDEEEEMRKMENKQQIFDSFFNNEKEKGSLANIGQLIYKCFKDNEVIKNCEYKITTSKNSYSFNYNKLTILFTENPNLKNDWKDYMKQILTKSGESFTYEKLENFFNEKFIF